MGYIFVSYSRKQLYFAESVVLNLERAGFDIWFDLQKLNPGIDWSSTLTDGYSNCDKLVFIASKAAIQSPYVQGGVSQVDRSFKLFKVSDRLLERLRLQAEPPTVTNL